MFKIGIGRSGPRTCFYVHYLASRKAIGVPIQGHIAPILRTERSPGYGKFTVFLRACSHAFPVLPVDKDDGIPFSQLPSVNGYASGL